jgi:hypothetical protein
MISSASSGFVVRSRMELPTGNPSNALTLSACFDAVVLSTLLGRLTAMCPLSIAIWWFD